MRNLPSTTATPGGDPLAPVYTFAISTGGDPTLLIIAGCVVAGTVLFLVTLAVSAVLGYRIPTARQREAAVGRAAAERAMAAAFPQTGRVVQAPAPRREVTTVGGRA